MDTIDETTQVTGEFMVNSSNSRNVRTTATGVQRVAIAALMMVLAVGGLAMSAGRAEAQKKPSLGIVIERFNYEAARKCGVTEDSLQAPAVLILRQNRIDVASAFTVPWLYINLNILSSGASCFFNLIVEIRTSQVAIDRNGFRANNNENVVLCSDGAAGIAPASGAFKFITDTIELKLKKCLAEVSY